MPNELQAALNKTVKVSPSIVPEVKKAVQLYEEHGGHLTIWPDYATDPLCSSESLSEARWETFHNKFPDINKMYEGIVHNSPMMFQSAVQFLRDVNYNYTAHLHS